jgi:hypothetical protein
VAALVQSCGSGEPAGKQADDRWCNGGYGNEVILFHETSSENRQGNGYFTRYSHLAKVTVDTGAPWLTAELALGEMGNTGNSLGTHLHFAVHQDNGNGQWDGDEVDLPIDPFGWAGLEPDPWAATGAGPVSRWLWRFTPTTEAILLGSQGATLRDGVGHITVHIPAGALAGQVRVELVTGATAPPVSSRRSLGRAFRLQVLDWLQGGNASNVVPARPVEVSVGFAGAATRHLDLDQLLLYHWQTDRGWLPLPTVVDRQIQAVIAAGNQFGDFDLQAPLLCPADALEPDDSFDAATFAADIPTPANASWERLLDVAEDEDWFQVEAVADTNYQMTVEVLSPGVALVAEVYDRDGLTRLYHRRGPGTLTWDATETGSYFVRVAPETSSNVGCEASYRLTLSRPGN